MNSKLLKILELASALTKKELMVLNQAVVSLIKTQQDVDFKKAAISFNKGHIVSFKDTNGALAYGVVTRKNPKTLQVTTPDDYYINIPATYLNIVDKPPKKLIDFRKAILPTYEEMYEIIKSETKDDTFH